MLFFRAGLYSQRSGTQSDRRIVCRFFCLTRGSVPCNDHEPSLRAVEPREFFHAEEFVTVLRGLVQ